MQSFKAVSTNPELYPHSSFYFRYKCFLFLGSLFSYGFWVLVWAQKDEVFNLCLCFCVVKKQRRWQPNAFCGSWRAWTFRYCLSSRWCCWFKPKYYSLSLSLCWYTISCGRWFYFYLCGIYVNCVVGSMFSLKANNNNVAVVPNNLHYATLNTVRLNRTKLFFFWLIQWYQSVRLGNLSVLFWVLIYVVVEPRVFGHRVNTVRNRGWTAIHVPPPPPPERNDVVWGKQRALWELGWFSHGRTQSTDWHVHWYWNRWQKPCTSLSLSVFHEHMLCLLLWESIGLGFIMVGHPGI